MCIILPEPFSSIDKSKRRTKVLTKGELAFRQDEPTRGLFYLQEGRLELRRFTEAGESIVIHHSKPGETFAEASLFSEVYHCNALALTDCILIEMDRTALLQKFASNGEFALALTERFACQIQSYRRKLEILAIRQADERVMAALTQDMLAHDIKSFSSEIGLTHETVYRSLAKLVTRGKLLKTGRGEYQIVGRHQN